jgi:bifunctional DNA-binding transcriptional regulator/antitoxin component of YhaV-PrlF toxin-antitoxin module
MASQNTATLSAKFQIAIPQILRSARHWHVGQLFVFVPRREGVLLVPVPRLEELAGLVRGAKPSDYRERTSQV